MVRELLSDCTLLFLAAARNIVRLALNSLATLKRIRSQALEVIVHCTHVFEASAQAFSRPACEGGPGRREWEFPSVLIHGLR